MSNLLLTMQVWDDFVDEFHSDHAFGKAYLFTSELLRAEPVYFEKKLLDSLGNPAGVIGMHLQCEEMDTGGIEESPACSAVEVAALTRILWLLGVPKETSIQIVRIITRVMSPRQTVERLGPVNTFVAVHLCEHFWIAEIFSHWKAYLMTQRQRKAAARTKFEKEQYLKSSRWDMRVQKLQEGSVTLHVADDIRKYLEANTMSVSAEENLRLARDFARRTKPPVADPEKAASLVAKFHGLDPPDGVLAGGQVRQARDIVAELLALFEREALFFLEVQGEVTETLRRMQSEQVGADSPSVATVGDGGYGTLWTAIRKRTAKEGRTLEEAQTEFLSSKKFRITKHIRQAAADLWAMLCSSRQRHVRREAGLLIQQIIKMEKSRMDEQATAEKRRIRILGEKAELRTLEMRSAQDRAVNACMSWLVLHEERVVPTVRDELVQLISHFREDLSKDDAGFQEREEVLVQIKNLKDAEMVRLGEITKLTAQGSRKSMTPAEAGAASARLLALLRSRSERSGGGENHGNADVRMTDTVLEDHMEALADALLWEARKAKTEELGSESELVEVADEQSQDLAGSAQAKSGKRKKKKKPEQTKTKIIEEGLSSKGLRTSGSPPIRKAQGGVSKRAEVSKISLNSKVSGTELGPRALRQQIEQHETLPKGANGLKSLDSTKNVEPDVFIPAPAVSEIDQKIVLDVESGEREQAVLSSTLKLEIIELDVRSTELPESVEVLQTSAPSPSRPSSPHQPFCDNSTLSSSMVEQENCLPALPDIPTESLDVPPRTLFQESKAEEKKQPTPIIEEEVHINLPVTTVVTTPNIIQQFPEVLSEGVKASGPSVTVAPQLFKIPEPDLHTGSSTSQASDQRLEQGTDDKNESQSKSNSFVENTQNVATSYHPVRVAEPLRPAVAVAAEPSRPVESATTLLITKSFQVDTRDANKLRSEDQPVNIAGMPLSRSVGVTASSSLENQESPNTSDIDNNDNNYLSKSEVDTVSTSTSDYSSFESSDDSKSCDVDWLILEEGLQNFSRENSDKPVVLHTHSLTSASKKRIFFPVLNKPDQLASVCQGVRYQVQIGGRDLASESAESEKVHRNEKESMYDSDEEDRQYEEFFRFQAAANRAGIDKWFVEHNYSGRDKSQDMNVQSLDCPPVDEKQEAPAVKRLLAESEMFLLSQNAYRQYLKARSSREDVAPKSTRSKLRKLPYKFLSYDVQGDLLLAQNILKNRIVVVWKHFWTNLHTSEADKDGIVDVYARDEQDRKSTKLFQLHSDTWTKFRELRTGVLTLQARQALGLCFFPLGEPEFIKNSAEIFVPPSRFGYNFQKFFNALNLYSPNSIESEKPLFVTQLLTDRSIRSAAVASFATRPFFMKKVCFLQSVLKRKLARKKMRKLKEHAALEIFCESLVLELVDRISNAFQSTDLILASFQTVGSRQTSDIIMNALPLHALDSTVGVDMESIINDLSAQQHELEAQQLLRLESRRIQSTIEDSRKLLRKRAGVVPRNVPSFPDHMQHLQISGMPNKDSLGAEEASPRLSHRRRWIHEQPEYVMENLASTLPAQVVSRQNRSIPAVELAKALKRTHGHMYRQPERIRRSYISSTSRIFENSESPSVRSFAIPKYDQFKPAKLEMI